jgi:hypothetical protein
MGISHYLIKHFGLPLTYAYATLQKSVAGNSPFQGIVFCNLGTSETVICHHANIVSPYISPYGYPNDVPGGQKSNEETKKLEHTNVLIPWYPISYLTIASSVFFGALTGPYPTLRFGGACGRGVGAF